MERRNRKQEEPGYLERWWGEQCGMCLYWLPLPEPLGRDFGVCTNAASPFDATVRFEHDGCDEFRAMQEWAQPGVPEED
jgi:hypothetical protein